MRAPTVLVGPRRTISVDPKILKLIAEGNSSHDIARTSTNKATTVDRHRSGVLRKLGIRDRFDLTRHTTRNGLVEP